MSEIYFNFGFDYINVIVYIVLTGVFRRYPLNVLFLLNYCLVTIANEGGRESEMIIEVFPVVMTFRNFSCI